MKISFLTLCILTVTSVSQADFDLIDDEALGDISGQSGVTIDADLYATIGSIKYTDEGSLSVNNIVIGGGNKQTYFGVDWGPGSHSGIKLDGSLIKIDVLADGDLVISGGVDPAVGGIIDFGITTGSVQLQSANSVESATIFDSISINGVATKFRMKIDASNSHILTDAEIGIADLDIDISGLNMKIEDVFFASSTYFESLEEWGTQGIALSDIVAKIKVDIHADDDGLHINPQSLTFDMGIGSVSIADASIGSFGLDNVDLSNVSMIVSGHP
ncbi:MAG: hypothetical protein ACJAYV_000588 [Oleispira sp.]|jgi:hypothetical protein